MRLDGEVCTYSLARSVKVSFSIVARLEKKNVNEGSPCQVSLFTYSV